MNHHHENSQAIIHRLSRAIGHLEAIKKMIAEDRDCSEVLVQIAAVKSAINNAGKELLKEHINHCVVDAALHGDQKVLEDLSAAIDQFMK